MSDTKALYDVVADALAEEGRVTAQDALEALMGRLRDAEADNAALIAKIRTYKHAETCDVEDEWDPSDTDGCECALKTAEGDHPGAALLEDLESLHHTLNAIGKALGFSDGAKGGDELVFAVESAKKSHEATQAALEAALKDVGALNRRVGFLEERERHHEMVVRDARDAGLEELERLRKHTGELTKLVAIAHDGALEEAAKVCRSRGREMLGSADSGVWAGAESAILALKKTGQGNG